MRLKFLRPLSFMLLLLVWVMGCTVEKKLNRVYQGKDEAYLFERLGKPVGVIPLGNGKKSEMFEKRTRLSRAPINTGQFQYDRFDSPAATKIETYQFDLNASGKVEKVQYDYRYER